MKTRVVCVPTSIALAGLILARPPLDRDKHPLLSAGTELDAAKLERLIKRGVEFVFVDVEDTRTPEEVAIARQETLARLDEIFGPENEPPHSERRALKEVVRAFREEMNA